MSENQKNYLKNNKKYKFKILIAQLSIIIIFFLTWELLAVFDIINTFIYSSPSLILNTLSNLYLNGDLLNHIFVTLYETIIVFILGLTLGFIFAILLYQFKTFAKIIDPYLTMLNSMPKVALGPLILIIAGANIKSIIFMALLINLIINIVTIYNGFINTDEAIIKLLKSFNATKLQILKKVIIPSSYTTIISSLKLNISMSLIGQ